jgi:hypothetical protein
MPSGGFPVEEGSFKWIRDIILSAACELGFTETRPTSFLSFELKVAEVLASWEPLWIEGSPSGEALRNNCWSFLTIIVMPDIALWRWPAPSDISSDGKAWKGRMLGGSRNTFQRIYRRVMCLDRGADHPDRWGLIRELQEDDFSAILERPGLSSNRDIAVCLGEEYLAMKQRQKHRSADERQSVYRQATKAIRAYGVVQPLDLLSNELRAQLVQAAFARYEEQLCRDLVVSNSAELNADPAISKASPSLASKNPVKPAGRSFLRRLLQGG